MGTKFEVDNSGNVDVKNNQVKNVGRLGLQNQSSDPGTPAEGQLYYNSTSKKLRIHNGSAFADVGGGNTAMTPAGSSGTTHSFKNPDFSLFFIGKNGSGQDGGPNINCPGSIFWPKAGGIGFGTVLGQWCAGFVTTANTSFGWTYNVASSVLSQMNYSGAYVLLGWDKKDKGSTPSDVVLRAQENTTSLTSVNPTTGFDTFGTVFSGTELDSFTDATERSISNTQGSGVTRFSQYILKVSNLTKNTLCAIAAIRSGAGSFTTSQAELFLWNFNTSAWDKTIDTFAAGECQSGGNGGSAASSQNVIACLVAKSATNYKSAGIAYARIVLTAPQPGGASASSAGTGYIGLVQADDYKET